MITNKELRALLSEIENDRVERTISTKDTDKFGEAICAFANDLPNHKIPGYLILGAYDNGRLSGLKVTDELLKNIAAIRTDGNIQPQPAMVVEKFSFDDGDLLVVEVQSATFPPVRYKGRVWVRVGPRKSVAGEAEITILTEKRASNINTFDATPFTGTSIDDLDTSIFLNNYLPKAFPKEVIESEKRDTKHLLQALGFFDCKYDCPTYAGVILFGKETHRFIRGAYTQYVRFSKLDMTGEVLKELQFTGNLFTDLEKIDNFVNMAISSTKPIFVSALREEQVVNYPKMAIRELMMNALMHRDYSSNAPTRLYEFDNHIEIQNPGGLYGKARPDNFPNVNDYRNPVIAEAMKVLGYVNRFSRGVLNVQKELKENGNGKAVFDLGLVTAFKVSVNVNTQLTKSVNNATVPIILSARQKDVLRLCMEPKTRIELFKAIGISNQTNNYQRIIVPLVATNYLECTIKGHPLSRKQKYVLTKKGKEIIDE